MSSSTAPLLAFGFASPLLLWGAALGGVPILLHLLHRRRHRERPWAAMRFLIAAIQRNQRRIRLEQLLLLAVRVLLLVLLATALAQPFAESFGKYFQADVPTHRVIILDVSFSMGTLQGDVRRFDRAKELAGEIITRARQGDAFNLLRISQSEPRTIVGEPAYQKQQVLSELDQVTLTDEPGDLALTLKDAADALARISDLPRKEVYFLSDFQAATWGGDSEAARALLRDQLKKIGESAEIVLIDIGDDAGNSAVNDLVAEESFAAVGRPVTLQATLRNYGSDAVPGQLAELYVDGRVAETRKIDLPAGGPVRADFRYTFQTAGDHDVELRLAADKLPIDNRRYLSVPVREELKVLLVNGRSSGKPAETATWYLEKSLTPSTERQRWQGLMRPKVISEGDLASTDLSKFDCVLLCDVRLVTDREANVLRTFVESGGGLILCPAGQTQADNYNQLLGSDGVDLLPGRFAGHQGDAKNPQEGFEFDAGDLSHPLVRAFQGNPGTGLESTLTFEYLQVVPTKDGATRVALKFASGDPAIVERDVGRGRVILFTTSADPTWGTWAVQRSFPPLIHEAVQRAVTGRGNERRLLVGEPIARTIPQAPTGLSVVVKGPDGRERPASVTDDKNLTHLGFEATDRAGLYDLTLGPPISRVDTFAVNVDPRESDPTRLQPTELREALLSGIEFDYRTDWTGPAAGSGSGRTTEVTVTRGGLTRWLLLCCLVLLFIEQLMAWNFVAGLIALLAAVGVLLTRNAFQASTAAGAALLVIVLVLAIAALWRMRRAADASMS